MKKHRFSLMELMLVGKIAVILCVLLLMTAARQRAGEISCRDNLRDIGVAMMLYEDRYGVMPYAYNADVEPSSYKMWCGLLFNAGLVQVSGPTYWGANAINCQTLTCPQSAALKLPKDYYHYGINGYLPNLLKITTGQGRDVWNRAAVRSTDISKPAQRLLIGDAVHFVLGGPSSSSRYPHENASMNAVFLDGRVENIPAKKLKAYQDYGTMFARF